MIFEFLQKKDITLQRQLGAGSQGTQALFFWRPALLEKYLKTQIPIFLNFHAKNNLVT